MGCVDVLTFDDRVGQATPIEIAQQERLWGGGEEDEFPRADLPCHFVNKQQSIHDSNHLWSLEHVEFIEDEVIEQLEEPSDQLIRRIATLAGSKVILLHHVMKDVGVGEDDAMVDPEVKKCIGTPQLDLCSHLIKALRIQPYDSQVLPAPLLPGLIQLPYLVADQFVRGIHCHDRPVVDQGR